MANLIFAEGFKLIYKWSKRWQRVLFAERINMTKNVLLTKFRGKKEKIMGLNIDAYRQEGNLWLPKYEERKPRETINFSRELIKARAKAKAAQLPQPQISASGMAYLKHVKEAALKGELEKIIPYGEQAQVSRFLQM